MDSLQLAHELGQNTGPLKAGGLVPGSTGYNPTLGKMCVGSPGGIAQWSKSQAVRKSLVPELASKVWARYVSVEELKSACSFCMKH